MHRRSILAMSLAALCALLASFAVASPAAASTAPGVASVAFAQTDEIAPMSHGFCNSSRRISLPGSAYARLPSIGSGTTHCVMNRGASSTGVTALQQAMDRCYSQINISIDGIYGSQTAGAVRTVQRTHQIGVDGVYGPQTRSAMWWQEFVGGFWTGFCVRGFI